MQKFPAFSMAEYASLEDYMELCRCEPEHREMLNAVMALPTKYRMILYLYYYEGYATAEIAEFFAGTKRNCPYKTCKRQGAIKENIEGGRMMSRKKFDEKCYKETMDCLHASDDVLEEVLKMTENRNAEGDKIQDDGQETRNRSKYGKNNDSQNRHWHPARVAAAAVVFCAVAGTMFSTEISTYAEEAIHFIEAKLSPASESDVETFADAALGDKSISTKHAERTNSSGEVLDDPDSQRVAVDSVTANELLSGNVQNVDATVEVGGYTFDFEQLVVDKNGNGMLSYTISNPDGVKDWYESGYGEINFNWYSNPNGGLVNPTIYSESGEELDSRLLLRSDISTDTELHVVACFTGNLQENEGIRLDLIKQR